MSLFKTITEGGQIWTHRSRMARQVFKSSFFFSVLIGIGFFGYQALQIPPFYYASLGYYAKAQALSFENTINIDGKIWHQLTNQQTVEPTVSIRTEIVKKVCYRYSLLLKTELLKSAYSGARFTLYTFGGMIVFFLLRGWRSRKKQPVEGKTIEPSWKLRLRLKMFRKASPVSLGKLPLVKNSETQHILISGSTGTGKTNAFYSLLPKIRELKQKVIIVDTTGEFVKHFYRKEEDIILNPFDARSASWHPWCECQDKLDFKAICQGFVPSSYREEESFWRKGAQEIFYCSLIEKAQEKKTSALVKLLMHDPLLNLSTFLKGTSATAYLDMSSEKTAASIRAVVAGYLECLEHLADTENPFSIRDWILDDKAQNWLFLSSTVQQRSGLIPLLSAWLSVAIHSLLQTTPDLKRRVWFVLDELPRLQRLHNLDTFVTESRKYGGCGLFAIQSPAQLETIYGRGISHTIIGNCATRVAFAEYDPQIAHSISKTFGEKEMRESYESISYGAHEMRDGVSLSFQSKISPVVTPTALQSLKPLQAFIKIPGNFPITKMRFKHQQFPKIAEGFIKKEA